MHYKCPTNVLQMYYKSTTSALQMQYKCTTLHLKSMGTVNQSALCIKMTWKWPRGARHICSGWYFDTPQYFSHGLEAWGHQKPREGEEYAQFPMKHSSVNPQVHQTAENFPHTCCPGVLWVCRFLRFYVSHLAYGQTKTNTGKTNSSGQ